MQVPRWRYVFISKNSLTPCSIRAAISSSSHFASFHSTPVASEKWKNKWNHVSLFLSLSMLKTYPFCVFLFLSSPICMTLFGFHVCICTPVFFFFLCIFSLFDTAFENKESFRNEEKTGSLWNDMIFMGHSDFEILSWFCYNVWLVGCDDIDHRCHLVLFSL